MTKNALFATTVIFLALGFALLDRLRFLIPYRKVLFGRYGATIAVFAAILFINLLAGIFALSRRFFLKDTGGKLAFLNHQLRSSESISEELSHRIEGEQ